MWLHSRALYIYIYIHTHMCLYIYIYIYTHTRIYIYIYTCVCVCVYIYIYIYLFLIIQCVKALVISYSHQLPTRGDNTVSVVRGSTATPGTTKQLLLLDRVFKRIIYIYIYVRSTKGRNYIVYSSSFLV